MVRLQQSDVDLLLSVKRSLSQQQTLDAFPWMALEAVKRLVPGVSYSYTVIDLEQQRSFGAMDPPESAPSAALIEVMSVYVHQHPLITDYPVFEQHGAQMISDHLSARDYHRLELYADFYRFLDTEDQLAIQLPAPANSVVGVVVNRDRSTFSERDRTLMNAIQGNLIHGYRNARAYTLFKESNQIAGLQAIWITPAGHVIHGTPGAQPLLDAYFGGERATGVGLPETLHDWFREQLRLHRFGTDGRPPLPFTMPGSDGDLIATFLAGPPGESDVILLENRRRSVANAVLATLGLTRRETEVVQLVIRGRSSSEIAETLGVKQRTVEKHLEHIYLRLGVTTRAGLVSYILQSLGT